MANDRQSAEQIRIQDLLYGQVTLDEPLLVDLYHSQAVQRLAEIYQAGISAFINPIRRTTRLDHSVGMTALLQRLGAGVLEQAAGLLHDVAHTAFSHVTDFLFPNGEHTFHEANRDRVVAASDLPAILATHGLDWRDVTDAERFALLEQPLPALCADRLDYFLRDGVVIGLISVAEAAECLAHLCVAEGQIVVDELEAAYWLGERFMQMDDVVWCSVQDVGLYAVMAQALGAAIESRVIAKSDLWGTDENVMARLRAARVSGVERWLNLIRPGVRFVRDDTRPDLVVLPKVRAVDPPILMNRRVQALSKLNSDFARRKAHYLANKQGPWGLRIERPRRPISGGITEQGRQI